LGVASFWQYAVSIQVIPERLFPKLGYSEPPSRKGEGWHPIELSLNALEKQAEPPTAPQGPIQLYRLSVMLLAPCIFIGGAILVFGCVRLAALILGRA
jgi:hypothetical protein